MGRGIIKLLMNDGMDNLAGDGEGIAFSLLYAACSPTGIDEPNTTVMRVNELLE